MLDHMVYFSVVYQSYKDFVYLRSFFLTITIQQSIAIASNFLSKPEMGQSFDNHPTPPSSEVAEAT